MGPLEESFGAGRCRWGAPKPPAILDGLYQLPLSHNRGRLAYANALFA